MVLNGNVICFLGCLNKSSYTPFWLSLCPYQPFTNASLYHTLGFHPAVRVSSSDDHMCFSRCILIVFPDLPHERNSILITLLSYSTVAYLGGMAFATWCCNACVFTYSLYPLLEWKLCRLETLAFVDRMWQVADSQYVVETVQINKSKDREKETNTTVLPW